MKNVKDTLKDQEKTRKLIDKIMNMKLTDKNIESLKNIVIDCNKIISEDKNLSTRVYIVRAEVLKDMITNMFNEKLDLDKLNIINREIENAK